jgi:hypothetical protein
MSLTQDEVQKMHDALKEAFESASRNWEGSRDNYDGNADKRRSLVELAATAAALLQADERLREMGQTASVTKLTPKMPGKD